MNRTFLIILYVILFAILLVPVAMGSVALVDNMPILVFLVVTLFYFTGTQYFSYRKNKKIIALLFEQCNPDAFIAQTQRQLDKVQHRGNIPYVLLQRLNLSGGLSAAGRIDEALTAAQFDISLIKSNRFGRLIKYMYHQNHFASFIASNMIEKAQEALLWLNDAVNAEKDAKLLEQMRRWYKNDYYRFEMANGRFDGAEAVFQEMFDRAENNYHRVIAMYTLGLVHEHFGRLNKAREAFEYVIAYGNKLHAVVSAKERLATMDAIR